LPLNAKKKRVSGNLINNVTKSKKLINNLSKTVSTAFHQQLNDKKVAPIIAHWNINGIRGKIDEVHLFLSTKCPIFLAITESKLDNTVPDKLLSTDDYTIIRRDRNSHGGGIIIFCRRDIKILSQLIQVVVQHFECISVLLKISWSVNFHLFAVYRPPSQNPEHFFNYLEKLILDTRKQEDVLLIVGDLNCNWLDSTNTNTKKLKDFCRSFSLFNGIKTVTRPKSNTSLDPILTSNRTWFADFNTHPSGISDHSICTSRIVFNKRKPPEWKTRRKTKRIDVEGLNEALSKSAWHSAYVSDKNDLVNLVDCDVVWENWNAMLLSVIDNFAPWQRKLLRKGQNGWMTQEIKSAIKIRDKLSGKVRDNATKQQFLLARNKVTSLKRARRKKYFEEVTAATNGAELHKRLQKETGLGKHRINSPSCLLVDNQLSEDPLSIAEALNNCFLSPLPNCETMSIDGHSSIKLIISQKNWPNFTFRFTRNAEIKSIIKRLKLHKSPGHDGITTDLMKMTAPALASPITDLFNHFIACGQIPIDFKLAIITPIYKKGDPKCPLNYRPISNLTVISKCLEKVLHNQLSDHFDKVLPTDMYGFRRGKSCEMALVNLIEYCRSQLDKGNHVLIISLDLSKAFDCVDHSLLIAKLQAYGLDKGSSELMSSYLSHRTQAVRINSTNSQRMPVMAGVPQGSLLGPLLFNMYVTDLSWGGAETFFRYADDTNLVISGNSPKELKETAEKQLSRVSNWFKSNHFILNPNKTQMLLLGRNRRPTDTQWDDFSITVDQAVTIYTMETIKLLGVSIDRRLTMENFVAETRKKIGYATKMAALIGKFLGPTAKKILMSSYIMTQADYCGVLFLNLNKSNQNKIELMLCKSFKILRFEKAVALNEVKVQRFRQISRMLCLFFMAVHYNDHPLLSHRIEIINSNTRSSIPIRIPLAKTEHLRNSLFHKCIRCWNNMPIDMDKVKTDNKVKPFITQLSRHWEAILVAWDM
jgi:exonuclease III